MFNFSGGLTSARFCLRRWSTSSLSQAFPKCSMSRQAKNRCPGPWGRSMAPSASSTCQQALSTTSGNIVRLTPTFLPYNFWKIDFRKIKSILLQSVQIKWHCVNCWSAHITRVHGAKNASILLFCRSRLTICTYFSFIVPFFCYNLSSEDWIGSSWHRSHGSP